jgi:hypothetical protein
VVGFFKTTDDDLRREFSAQFDVGGVVSIPNERFNPKQAFDVKSFAQRFNNTLADGTQDEILIVVADLVPWATAAVERLAGQVVGRAVGITKLRDARSSEPVAVILRGFVQPMTAGLVEEQAIRAFVDGRRILCVRGSHQAPFADVFERQQFDQVCFDTHCTERTYDPEKNSNLIRDLKDAAVNFGCVLYAWHGLRTAPHEVKAKYPKGRFFEDSTTSRVVQAFKRSVTGTR